MDARLLIIPLLGAMLLCFGMAQRAQAAVVAGSSFWQQGATNRNGATLDLDFVHNNYLITGTTYNSISSFITGAGATFTRASVATYFDSTGTLQTASAGTPRIDYGPTGGTQAQGLLMEISATNSIRNNTMVGAQTADGVERTANGTFSSCSGATCTGWTTTVNGGSGTVAFTSGQATLTGDGTNAASIYQPITIAAGYIYTIAVTNASGNAITVQAGTTVGGTNLEAATSIAANTTQAMQFLSATGGSAYVQINNASATAANITAVSVQSAGAPPTDWVNGINSVSYPVVGKIVGKGVENGISYIDVNFAGTSIIGGFQQVYFDSYNGIAAVQSQAWVLSSYLKLVGGSFANVTAKNLGVSEINSSGTQIGVYDTASITPTSAALNTQRYIDSFTVQSASTVNIYPYFQIAFNPGAVINLTLRIGMPQLERTSYYTSVIPTSGGAVTRQTDVFSVASTAGGGWSTAGVGTLLADALDNQIIGNNVNALAAFDDGTGNNAINMLFGGTGYSPNNFSTEIFIGGSAVTGGCGTSNFTLGSPMKEAYAYTAGAILGALNGGACSPGTGTLPTLTTLRIGNGRGGGGNYTGWIRRIGYLPTASTSAAVIAYSQGGG